MKTRVIFLAVLLVTVAALLTPSHSEAGLRRRFLLLFSKPSTNAVVSPEPEQTGGTPVDLLFKWSGSNGELLTTNNITTSTIGDLSGTISYVNDKALQHAFITNVSATLPYAYSLGGNSYSNFTQFISFNLDALDTNASPSYDSWSWQPTNAISNLTVEAVIELNISGGANYDILQIAGGQYSVADFVVVDGAAYATAHGQVGASSSKVAASMILTNGAHYILTLRHNVTEQKAEVMMRKITGELVGVASTPSEITNVSYLHIQDYLWLTGSLGDFKVGPVALNWTTAPMPLGDFPTVPPATNFNATQFSESRIDLTWNKLAETPYKIERSTNSGANWTTLTNGLIATNYSDTDSISVGDTYDYRISANAFEHYSIVQSDSVTVSASAGYIDTIDFTESDSSHAVGDSSYVYLQKITLPSGEVSKLRIHIRGFVGDNGTKIALYNSDGNLVCNGSGTASGTGWFEVITSATSISAGDYWVSWESLNSVSDLEFGYKAGVAPGGFFDVGSYFTFPRATVDDEDTAIGGQFAVGVYITP